MDKLLIYYDQVFFIFDRYNSDSIKGEERLVRSKGVTRTFVLSLGVEMPAQKIVTSVTRDKVQLIDLIVASLTDDPILSPEQELPDLDWFPGKPLQDTRWEV